MSSDPQYVTQEELLQLQRQAAGGGSGRAKRRRLEGAEGEALILWADSGRVADLYPGMATLYHVPNGGHRKKWIAAEMKAEGVRAGIPDYCLPLPRGGYHGAYLELKVGSNKPTPDQAEWLELLQLRGYYAAVAWSAENAKAALIAYYDLGPFTWPDGPQLAQWLWREKNVH